MSRSRGASCERRADRADIVEKTVSAWQETGEPLYEMEKLEMTAAVAKRLDTVTTAGTLGRTTAALRAAKEAAGR